MNEQDAFQWLKGLPNRVLSGQKHGDAVEITGENYNVIDCWRGKFYVLSINASFVNYLDLSGVRADEVVLIGKFNKVDLTKAVIGTLRINEAEIIDLDRTGVRITEIFENKG